MVDTSSIDPNLSQIGLSVPEQIDQLTAPTPDIYNVSPGDVAGSIGGTVASLGEIFPVIGAILAVIEETFTAVSSAHPVEIIKAVATWANEPPTFFNNVESNLWDYIQTNTIGRFYKALLHNGLGVDVEKFDADGKRGVQTVDSMLGFAVTMQLASMAVSIIGKPLLANRWAEGIHEAFGKLVEATGLSWALGLQIDEAFKVAVGESVAEGINRQKRGTRIEWGVLRAMYRQHLFQSMEIDRNGKLTGKVNSDIDFPGASVFRDQLEAQGFPDSNIDLLMALADQQLPVGDLQAMYQAGIKDEDAVHSYIKKLGFTKTDAADLLELYVTKSETAAGAQLKATARSLTTQHLMTIAEYEQVLKDINYPEKQIADDIKAITLEQSLVTRGETISLIHQQLIHGQIVPDTAKKKLIEIGQDPTVASDLVAIWTAPPVHPQRTLSQSKILSYLAANIISKQEASDKLVALNIDPADITLLINNPTISHGVVLRKRSPGLVVSAYLDGAIDQAQLKDKFASAGVAPDDIDYWYSIALYRYAHRKKVPVGTLPLTKAEIIDAAKYGIWSPNTAEEQLQLLGYSSDYATLLLEIGFKTKFPPETASQAPDQTDLQAALTLLESKGFRIYPPPDPAVTNAEAVLSANGYTWIGPDEKVIEATPLVPLIP